MKIIGWQKDFFDTLIYTYGIDEGIRLDRTIYSQLESNLDTSNYGFLSFNNYYFWVKYKKSNKEYFNLLSDLNRHKNKVYKRALFYFDAKVYMLYYDININLNSKSVYEINVDILKDINGNPIVKDARQDLIDFSMDNKLPYFLLNHDFFFPFMCIRDCEKYFDKVDVYQKVENFMLTHGINTTEIQSNDNKIESHGFDIKTSFRSKI